MANVRTRKALALTLGALVLTAIVGCSDPTSSKDHTRTIVLPARDDAHITANAASADDPQSLRSKNYGSEDALAVSYANKINGSPQLVVSVALTQFDTASLKGLEVQSATLQLFGVRVDLTEPVRLVDVSPTTGAWSEKDVTFDRKPEWPGTAIATAAVYAANVWYSWDVTATVAAAKGGDVGYVLGLRSLDDGKAEQALFASHEASGTNAPRLVVIYRSRESVIPLWAIIAAAAAVVVLVALAFVVGLRLARRKAVTPS